MTTITKTQLKEMIKEALVEEQRNMDPQIGLDQDGYDLIVAEQEFHSYVSKQLYKLAQNLTKPRKDVVQALLDPVVFPHLSKDLKRYIKILERKLWGPS